MRERASAGIAFKPVAWFFFSLLILYEKISVGVCTMNLDIECNAIKVRPSIILWLLVPLFGSVVRNKICIDNVERRKWKCRHIYERPSETNQHNNKKTRHKNSIFSHLHNLNVSAGAFFTLILSLWKCNFNDLQYNSRSFWLFILSWNVFSISFRFRFSSALRMWD